MRTSLVVPPAVLLLVMLTAPIVAASTLVPSYHDEDLKRMHTRAYLAGHPDYRWRREGLAALERGEPEAALEHFRLAASYADKAAQALIGEMYWEGRGVTRDRALGYVWMSLAAERMYRRYEGLREIYWASMDASEQEQALRLSPALHAEFADQAAQPRLQAMLRQGRPKRTGSHVGASFGGTSHTGNAPGMTGGSGGSSDDDGETKYWYAQHYWAWQDELYESLRHATYVRTLKSREERRASRAGMAVAETLDAEGAIRAD